MEILTWPVLGQALWRWGVAVLTALASAGLIALIRYRAVRPPFKEGLIGDIEAAVASIRRAPSIGVSVFLGSRWLANPAGVERLLLGIFVVAVGVQIGLAALVVVQRWLRRYVYPTSTLDASLEVLDVVASAVIWTVVVLMVLGNLGINVSGLVASLGVGGIAIALAAQNILGDLFASLSIVLDRPFEPGDFIKVGNELGVVKKVGLKTTRVVALQGEELVFGNTDLLKSRIQNFKKMRERRVVLEFGLEYGTSVDDIKAVPEVVSEIIKGQQGARFDRAHFRNFGDSALMFEAVYYVDTNDFNAFMDRQQAINLNLLTKLRERGLTIAFPTRTIHVQSVPPSVLREPPAAPSTAG